MNTDSLIIDIQSTSKDSTKNIDSLVESLENLSKALSDVISQSNSFKNLKNITSSVKSSNKINQQNIGTESRDAQLRELKVGDFKSLEKNLLSETTSMDKVISKYKTGMGGIVTITEKTTTAGQKFNVVLKQTHPQVKTLSEQLKNAQNVMGKVHAKMVALGAGLIGMVKKSVDFVDKASAEAEALNLFTVSMGEYAEEGTRWLEKFSNALYLDPVSVQQYMGSFNSLVKGLGVGSENAYKMSKNLTQLVYDLSSFKNISIESSYEKLMSGISGELEPLRNVGVAMSEATLQTLAYDLGIEKMVRNMTEAEKAQLRYIQIMRSSTEWQTDMGRTLITPANALRVMRQQFVQLGRAIGKVFIPIIMSAMPYVIAITQMLTALAQKLANFLGYEIADIDYSGLGDISAGITDIGTSADKTAEKLNTMLAPFDDLNVVQNQAKNASSGLGGIGGDLGVELPEYDALANLNEKFAEGVDKAKKNLKAMLPIVLAIGGAFATWKITGAVAGLLSFFGIGKGKKGATSAGSKGLTTLLPTWKTLFKGMAQLATLIGGVVIFIEALGLLTRIPGFKENITTGIDILTETFWGIAKIAIPLAGFSASVSVLGTLVNPVTMLKGIGDLALVIGGLELVVLAVGGIMSIPSLTNVLDSGIKSIQNVFNGLSEIALPLSGFTLALGLLGLTGGAGATAILTGLGLFAEVIIGLQVVVGALGGLSQIPGFTWLIGEGGKALSQIGSVLGGFAGSIAEAFTTNVFDSIPTLGTQLSDFMTNAKPFFDGIASIDDGSVLAVKTLAETILILTATNIIEGLTSWFAGETSLVGFGKELADFAPHFARYADAIKGINADVVVASSNSAKSIAEMANTLPNRGGLLAEIMGENDLSEFGKMLPDFGKNLKKYSDNVSGVDSGVVTSSANVAKAIAEMAKTLPNDGGLLGLIMGENDLKNFGKMLPDFGKNLKKYAENVKGVDTDVVTSSINSAKAISSLASGLENQGGMISWFTGDNKLSTFGKELKSFGDSFKKYYDTVKNISMDKVNNITNGIGVLVGHLKTISTNKLNPILKDFGTNLSTASTGISSFFSQTFSSSQASSLGSTFGAKLGESIKSSMKNKMGTSISLKNEYGTNLATYSIKAYETGGYPTSGELFFANENGMPEMVGRIGNQTAVANNDQITTSITNALMSALNQYDFGGGKSPTTIYIGNKKVYEGYGDYVADENDRYGTNMIKI